MASNTNNNNDTWIAETVCDFIHSPIWTAPIHTFIEANCAAFDFDDDISRDDDDTASMEEKMHIHQQYEHLVDSLIGSLGQDLGLDPQALRQACQSPSHEENWANIDESYEQLYSAKDFEFFEEMMKRKNLILQLQAIVNLQLRWGLLKQSDTADDFILSLLLQATTIPSQRGSISHAPKMVQGTTSKHELPSHPFKSNDEDDDDDDDVVVVPRKQSARQSSPPPPQRREPVEPRKTPKAQYQLPNLRHKGGSSLNADWYRNLPAHDHKVTSF
jgi:The ARF-like 2 binding protein BART